MKSLVKIASVTLCIFPLLQACIELKMEAKNVVKAEANQFNADIRLLSKAFNPVVLSDQHRQVIVVPELQGRVMTATTNSNLGETLGWFNRAYLSQKHSSRSTPIGGADRLMFGPETGEFSQFFQPGKERIVDNLYAQDAIVLQPYQVLAQTKTQVTVQADIQLINNSGTQFDFNLNRRIKLFSKNEIEQMLETKVGKSLDYVGYGSDTKITNTGQAWRKETGLVSLWHLGAFKPSQNTTVVIPTEGEVKQATAYFNQIKPSHTQTTQTHVFYKADAEYMNKTGVPVENTKPVMGAYDAQRNLLTIILFNISSDKKANYVTASWLDSSDAYGGEIVNVFNDGPNDFGQYFGPFYEMETSSAAFELAHGESQSHYHYTLHFQGDTSELNELAIQILGVSIKQIEQVFE